MKDISMSWSRENGVEGWRVGIEGLGCSHFCKDEYERDMYISELKYRMSKIDEQFAREPKKDITSPFTPSYDPVSGERLYTRVL